MDKEIHIVSGGYTLNENPKNEDDENIQFSFVIIYGCGFLCTVPLCMGFPYSECIQFKPYVFKHLPLYTYPPYKHYVYIVCSLCIML